MNETTSSMIRLAILGGSISLFGTIGAAAEKNEVISSATLQQCYQWAKARSEALKIRQEDIEQSKARGRAALGGALPNISWKFNDTWQEPQGVEKLESQGFSGFVEKEQAESKFSVEQPLFSGFREYSAWSGFKKERLRNALRLERASQELYEKTASAFYTVLSHQSDAENTQAAWTLAEERVQELRSFLRLGKARESEVFTAQAHAAALKAEIKQIQARIASAREELSFLTGKNISSLLLMDEISHPPVFESLGQAMIRAQGRTDLQAQREDVASKKLRIRYERGLYWPSADITGNYYLQRATFLDEIDWDVVLSLRMPIFQGGTVSAKVREAVSAYRQSLLTLEELERSIIHNVRKLHNELSAAVEETRSLEEAAEAAEKSYNALKKEYKLGLVTNLEVLEALDLLQSQKRASDTTRWKTKLLYIQLQVATEALP